MGAVSVVNKAKYTSVSKKLPRGPGYGAAEDDATRFLKVEKTKLDAEPKEHAEDGGRRRSGAGSGSSCWSSWRPNDCARRVMDKFWVEFLEVKRR